MRILMLFCLGLIVSACTGTGAIRSANENAVVIVDGAGNFGDSGAELADEHCAKYGKVAVHESSTGTNTGRRHSYLCR